MLENTSSNATSSYKPDFDDTTRKYCMEFGQQSESTVFYYLKTELEKATYYSVEDYFQRAGCRIEGYGGDVPLLHMVVDYPSYRQNFAEKVFNYYHKRRKSHDLWLKAINAKNTKGQTLLDYLESQLQANAYRNEGTLNAAKSIGKYICENIPSMLTKNAPSCLGGGCVTRTPPNHIFLRYCPPTKNNASAS